MKAANRHPVIFLTGFMASGKTSAARALAQVQGVEWYDTDKIVQDQAGRSITEIFSSMGRHAFRDMEHEAVRKVCACSGCVAALGGGAFMHQRNRDLVSKAGISIALLWPLDVLINRITDPASRPLLAGLNKDDMLERSRTLLQQREPVYQQADVVLRFNSELSLDKVVQSIQKKLEDIR